MDHQPINRSGEGISLRIAALVPCNAPSRDWKVWASKLMTFIGDGPSIVSKASSVSGIAVQRSGLGKLKIKFFNVPMNLAIFSIEPD